MKAGTADLPLHDGLGATLVLAQVAQWMEEGFKPDPGQFDKMIEKESRDSWKYGGRTVFGKVEKPEDDSGQLRLFG